MKKLVLLLLSTMFYCTLQAQVIHDESYKDFSFSQFKIKLSHAIFTRNLAFLKTCFADTIYESNDGCGYPGCVKSEFFKYYFKDAKSENWAMLEKIMQFGFYEVPVQATEMIRIGEKAFYGPSYFKTHNEDSQIVVLGNDVSVRKSPGLKADVVAKVSYQFLKCECNIITMTDKTYVPDVDGHDWIAVLLPNGQTGYIASKFTSQSIQKRLVVQKINGKWLITHFYEPPGC